LGYGPEFSHPRWLRVCQAFWVPLVAGLLMWATRPLFWFCGGTPPKPPAMGAPPPWTPLFSRPRGLRVRQRSGSHSWAGSRCWQLAPLLVFGGTSPKPPGRGLRPLHPHFPTLVGFGFASVLGPTRGGVANVGYSPLLLVLWGDTPQTPRHGGSAPLDPPLPTPVGLGFAKVLGPTRGGVDPSPEEVGENTALAGPGG
jgi:hypothetical protein